MSALRQWVGDRATLLIFIVMCMNLLDGVMTQSWMNLGVIEEANPLMAYLLELGPGLFLVVKVSLVTMGCFILWRYRYRGSAQVSIAVVLAVYAWVMFRHAEVWKLLETYGHPGSPTL